MTASTTEILQGGLLSLKGELTVHAYPLEKCLFPWGLFPKGIMYQSVGPKVL